MCALPLAGFPAAVLAICLATGAAAQGICVVCNGPDAVYRCQPDASVTLRPGDARLNLLCITEIARADGHASCGVLRQQASSCDGLLRTVTISAAPPPAGGLAEPQPADVTRESSSEPPDTVAELAKRTANSSKDQLDKATGAVGDVAKKTGGAVGDAAKMSWRCLSSLFKDC